MAQNRFIRPFSTNYHDFTQQRLEQTFEQTPYKFRSRLVQDQYIKKPKYTFVQPVRPPPPMPPRQTCMQSCCRCLSNCKISIFNSCCCQRHQYIDQRNNYNLMPKPGRCFCQCFEPELCADCIIKLCPQCYNTMCLKLNLCSSCKNMLCVNCRKSIWCVSHPKIRDYPIPIKDRRGLHFENCECSTCITLKVNKKLISQNSIQKLLAGGPQNQIQPEQIMKKVLSKQSIQSITAQGVVNANLPKLIDPPLNQPVNMMNSTVVNYADPNMPILPNTNLMNDLNLKLMGEY